VEAVKQLHLGLCGLLLFVCTSVKALTIDADNSNATLSFSGEHAGMAFDGVFERWQSRLVLPPEDAPSVSAEFTLSSAKTGDSTYDETLPEEDWFFVQKYPTAQFSSSSVTAVSGGYLVSGKLSLRGKVLPVEFKLERQGDTLVTAFDIDRLAFGIGMDSDPDAEWVSQTIRMSLTIAL